MKILLDSHTLVWAVADPRSLSPKARQFIHDPENEPLVSAASAWEISTKVHSARWPEAEAFERNFLEGINRAGFTLISITPDDALRSARLLGVHRDPFDRMIAAQALALDIPVISVDKALDSFGVRRIW